MLAKVATRCSDLRLLIWTAFARRSCYGSSEWGREKRGSARALRGIAHLALLFAGPIVTLALLGAAGAAFAAPRLSFVSTRDHQHLLVAQEGDPGAPAILFLHGFAQSYLSFRRQFASNLTAHYHLVAFDLRGQGGSDKPGSQAAYASSRRWADDVAAVIRATGLKRPIIVGWSYGGYVAMDYVRHYGTGGIAGVDLVGSLGGLPGAPSAGAAANSSAATSHARSDRQRAYSLADNIAANKETAAGYVTANMTSDERDTLIATEMMMPAYVRRFMTARRLDNSDLLERLASLPVLVSRGSLDGATTPAATARILQLLPRAKLSQYDGKGHLVFIEDEARFNSELADFAHASGAR